MAYFCLSHNHCDHHGLMAQIIGRTLGYTTGELDKQTITTPYKDSDVTIGQTTQSAFNASSDRATLLGNMLKNIKPSDQDADGSHTDLVYVLTGDKSNCVYGDIHFQGGVDDSQTIDTTTYDNIIALSNSKVIHCTWSDWSHSSWTTTFKARCDTMDTGDSVSDWDERLNHYETAMKAITYPTGSDNFVLYQDKILDKDETHYGELATFLGATALSNTVWKGLVTTYNTHLSS